MGSDCKFQQVIIRGKRIQMWRFKCPKCNREQILNGENRHMVKQVDGKITIEPNLICAYKRSKTNPCDWEARVGENNVKIREKSV
jgi:hypothetical protein